MSREERSGFAEAAETYRAEFERERSDYVAQNEPKMMSSAGVAAKIVSWPRENSLGFWEFWINGADGSGVVVEDYRTGGLAALDADVVREIVAEAIEQARCDGAVDALREVASRAEAAAGGVPFPKSEGLMCAAGIARELASRPRSR